MAANASAASSVPSAASAAVLKPSDPVPDDAVSVEGPNFDKQLSLQEFLASYERIGFQANHLGKAIHVVNNMVSTHYPPRPPAFADGHGTAQMAPLRRPRRGG